MSLRDDLLPVFDEVRGAIADTTGLGMRQHRLFIVTRSWSGEMGASGSTYVDDELEITPRPKMRDITSADQVDSAGRFATQTILAYKITPSYSGGGWTPEQLRPPNETQNVEVFARVEGPFEGEYQITNLTPWKNFAYDLTLQRKRTTP